MIFVDDILELTRSDISKEATIIYSRQVFCKARFQYLRMCLNTMTVIL